MRILKKGCVFFLMVAMLLCNLPVQEIVAAEQMEESLINYAIVDSPFIETGQEQNIVISIGEQSNKIQDAELKICNKESNEITKIGASKIEKNAVRFSKVFTDNDPSGSYVLDSVEYRVGEILYNVSFSEIGIDAEFGYNKYISTSPDAEITNDDVPQDVSYECQVLSDGEDTDVVTGDSIENVLNECMITKRYGSEGNIVIVLDPGHDATHAGAHSAGGLQEADLTLKIANYCADELRQYNGVSVYMTRTSAACPYPGTSSGDDLINRVNFAKSVGCDLYVSIHLNTASASSACGAEVYYPNANYNSNANKIGSGAASSILEQLVGLGLNDRGTKIKNRDTSDNEPEDYYPDGSVADSYSVIRNSKKSGFTGIIIEHAFLSSDTDVASFLSNESTIQCLGVADAIGIANYYGLSKGSQTVYNGIDYSAVYDKDYYYEHNPDVAAACGNNSSKLLEHFVQHGMSEGRRANENFDVSYYKNRYSDLRQAFGDDLRSYYLHYINGGKAEKRLAHTPTTKYNNQDYSVIYNYDDYMSYNSDINQALGGDDNAALEHFVKYGMSEGRQASSEFNVEIYKKNYSDLRQAFGNNNSQYYLHYLNYGKNEGRVANKAIDSYVGETVYNGKDYSSVYNYKYYINTYSDIKNAFGNDDNAALEHFVKYGMSEGRQGSSEFSVKSYYNRYRDLRKAFGNDWKSYYLHYVNYGKAEGRQASGAQHVENPETVYDGVDYSAVYDYQYYINTYPDIKNAFEDDDEGALAHFVNNGMLEGRQGNAEFCYIAYKNNNKDLRVAFGNDVKSYVVHYSNYGRYEGRVATGNLQVSDPITVYNGIDYSSIYDFNSYLSMNPDLQGVFTLDDMGALAHFVNYGMNEARCASSDFNVFIYYNNYSDLQNAFGDNWREYYLHYLHYGKSEGRVAK